MSTRYRGLMSEATPVWPTPTEYRPARGPRSTLPQLDEALIRFEADFNALAWIAASHSPLEPGIKFMIGAGLRSLDELPEGIAQ